MNSKATDLEKLADKLSSHKTGDWDPVDSGPFNIRIATDGTWYYRGSPIERKPLVKLFSSVLMRDGDGQYWLRTPVEKGLIDVEDAPFVVIAMTVDTVVGNEQVVRLTTNVDDTVTMDRNHPLRVAVNPDTGEPRPYVTVRDNLEGRIGRAVYYDLAALAVPDAAAGRMGVWSAGVFHDLGPAV